MRDNEPLGIYAELRARAERYGEGGEKLRRRVLYPPTVTGPSAQPVNPFMGRLSRHIRLVSKPNAAWGRRLDRRSIWPEAQLGIAIDIVIKAVVDESGITAEQMLSDWRGRRYARPRQVAIYMIDRYCPDYSQTQVGYIFSRDHSTIKNAIEAVTGRLLDQRPETVDLVTRVHKRLREIAG